MKKMVYFLIPFFAAAVGITACGAASKSVMVAETTGAYSETAAETVSNDSESYDYASQKAEGGTTLNTESFSTPCLLYTSPSPRD